MVTSGITVVTVLMAWVWAVLLAAKRGVGRGRLEKVVDAAKIGCVAEASLDGGHGVEGP